MTASSARHPDAQSAKKVFHLKPVVIGFREVGLELFDGDLAGGEDGFQLLSV